MSIRTSDPRHERAARGLAELGDAVAEHEVLSVQCHHSHHVAAVYETPAGLVFRSVTGLHAHGRKDRADVAHHGSTHGQVYAELLDDPQAEAFLPGSCDCGPWNLSRADLVADVRSGRRTAHVG
jgi:diadenosine tetraphosphatase ApaH/serine/threonine PP2A family protein phosphatase